MTIDLQTGQTFAPRPADYMTKITGTIHDAAATAPLWQGFLKRVTGDDADLQAYLARVAGYCLTGSVREHVMFFLYGTGANGKSTFTSTIGGVMGDYAVAAPIETFIESRGERHPTELALLAGARLVIATETEEGRRWSEAKLKSLTGGDPISARFMRQDFFTFAPRFKLLICGNHKPSLRSVDEAIRRRMHLIPFAVQIPPAERDLNLADKLKAEWPGVLNWMLEGCREWQRIGLAPPAAVRNATDSYLAEEDALKTWLEESTEAGNEFTFETTTALFQSWRAWAERAAETPGTMKRFSEALRTRGYAWKRTSTARGFEGIRLKRPDYSDDSRYGQ